MLSRFEMLKHVATGIGLGLAVFVFAVGAFTCAGFVLAQISKSMGCAG